jgi:Sodium/hydrogen exchanger family
VAAAGEFVATGAPIGIVLLLLTLGLEFSAAEFASSLRHHLPSAGVDIVLNATPGAVAGWLLGLHGVAILALAGVTYISSSGVVARLLEDLRRLGNRETPAVLSVLVLEDFAMAAYLPLFAVLASGGSWLEALGGMLAAVGALLAAFAASFHSGHHVGRLVAHPDSEQLLQAPAPAPQSADVQGDHQPSASLGGAHPVDAAGDGVNPGSAAIGTENLGSGHRIGVSGRLQPQPAQYRCAFVLGPADGQHGVDEAGCQQRPQLG